MISSEVDDSNHKPEGVSVQYVAINSVDVSSQIGSGSIVNGKYQYTLTIPADPQGGAGFQSIYRDQNGTLTSGSATFGQSTTVDQNTVTVSAAPNFNFGKPGDTSSLSITGGYVSAINGSTSFVDSGYQFDSWNSTGSNTITIKANLLSGNSAADVQNAAQELAHVGSLGEWVYGLTGGLVDSNGNVLVFRTAPTPLTSIVKIDTSQSLPAATPSGQITLNIDPGNGTTDSGNLTGAYNVLDIKDSAGTTVLESGSNRLKDVIKAATGVGGNTAIVLDANGNAVSDVHATITSNGAVQVLFDNPTQAQGLYYLDFNSKTITVANSTDSSHPYSSTSGSSRIVLNLDYEVSYHQQVIDDSGNAISGTENPIQGVTNLTLQPLNSDVEDHQPAGLPVLGSWSSTYPVSYSIDGGTQTHAISNVGWGHRLDVYYNSVENQATASGTINSTTQTDGTLNIGSAGLSGSSEGSTLDGAGVQTALQPFAGDITSKYTGTGTLEDAGITSVKINSDGSVTVQYDTSKAPVSTPATFEFDLSGLVLTLTPKVVQSLGQEISLNGKAQAGSLQTNTTAVAVGDKLPDDTAYLAGESTLVHDYNAGTVSGVDGLTFDANDKITGLRTITAWGQSAGTILYDYVEIEIPDNPSQPSIPKTPVQPNQSVEQPPVTPETRIPETPIPDKHLVIIDPPTNPETLPNIPEQPQAPKEENTTVTITHNHVDLTHYDVTVKRKNAQTSADVENANGIQISTNATTSQQTLGVIDNAAKYVKGTPGLNRVITTSTSKSGKTETGVANVSMPSSRQLITEKQTGPTGVAPTGTTPMSGKSGKQLPQTGEDTKQSSELSILGTALGMLGLMGGKLGLKKRKHIKDAKEDPKK